MVAVSDASDNDPLTAAVLATGVATDARIVVAVSGGADSVALLDVLWRLTRQPENRWKLCVAHINHRLRDEESGIDERFVRDLARRYDLPVEVRRADTRSHAAQHRLSLETAARELRYAYLEDIRSAFQGDWIATAHTLNDQAESLLLHLLRGSGLTGLGGMRVRRGRIVRPLLAVSHEDVITYIQRHGLGYRVDSSNADTRHLRNRLRRELIPRLEDVQRRAVASLGRAAALLQADAEYLAQETSAALQLADVSNGAQGISASTAIIKELHPSLRRLVLRSLLATQSGIADVDAGHVRAIERVLETSRGTDTVLQTLPHSVAVRANAHRLSIEPRFTTRSPLSPASTTLPIPGRAMLAGGEIAADLLDGTSADTAKLLAVCGPFHALCDAAALGACLNARARRPGDRIRPAGRRGSRKLQDLFVDAHVPLAERDRIPVLEHAGQVVWIPGYAVDERVAATAETRLLAHLSFRPDPAL